MSKDHCTDTQTARKHSFFEDLRAFFTPKNHLAVSSNPPLFACVTATAVLLLPVVLLALAGLIAMPDMTQDDAQDTPQPACDKSLRALADLAADRYKIPRDLFAALIARESSWRADAISEAGAIGLTQVMPRTGASHCGMSTDQLSDPEHSLECGASYLSAQFNVFKDWRLALAGYNAGPSQVIRSGGIPDIAETQAYVRVICGESDCDMKELGGAI